MNNHKGLTTGQQILRFVKLSQINSSLPVWGEIFHVLYKIKRSAETRNRNLIAYKVQGNHNMEYHVENKRFVLTVDEITLNLKINELTTSILKGRFLPVEEDS
ncbi:hypothetical protein [Ammoniphilus resinae]|nr:hypothetical protein [Ammoniphilus resinae]